MPAPIADAPSNTPLDVSNIALVRRAIEGDAAAMRALVRVLRPAGLPQAGIHLLNRSPLKPVPMGAPQPVVNCGSVRMPTPNPWTIQPCPLDDPIAARNLDVGPQPLDPMCPTCFLSDQGQIFVGLELVPDIPGGFLHDVYLKVSDGFQDQVFALPGPLPQEHSELLILSPTGWSSSITKAWLQYVVIKNGQSYLMGEPLLVD